MAIRIYNTLSRRMEQFSPIDEPLVRIYICGLTVYGPMHIGHARTYMAFDAVIRYLKWRGFRIMYVQNITDVDDKIIAKSKKMGVKPSALVSQMISQTLKEQKLLGLYDPDERPRVTQHIGDIIDAISGLISKGFAYEAERGVYFDLSKSGGYGSLSLIDPDNLCGNRLEPDPSKKNPVDFSLWKKVPPEEYGFESPWGHGRPGWHIECSVMSEKHLGPQIDIHGGALDLVFPHHENEIAQSEAITGKKPFVRYWMHTGLLTTKGEKMSKSLGNILSVGDMVKSFDPQIFRLFIFQTHYRSPVEYGEKSMLDSKKALQRLMELGQRLDVAENGKTGGDDCLISYARDMRRKFMRAMDDDFNTPKALAAIFEFVKKANPLLDEGRQNSKAKEIYFDLVSVLGFEIVCERHEKDILDLVELRNGHRMRGEWSQADRIRDMLKERGIILNDLADGTTKIGKTEEKIV